MLTDTKIKTKEFSMLQNKKISFKIVNENNTKRKKRRFLKKKRTYSIGPIGLLMELDD